MRFRRQNCTPKIVLTAKSTKAKPAGAEAWVPPHPTLKVLQKAVHECRGCDLYRNATQAVFGEGPATARIMFVGEQPGNEEDIDGHPFVGPAGKMLNKALIDAGIPREEVYVTNAVKHFKFEERGKRRIHKKPSTTEIKACKPWLEAEVETVKPHVIVCLGASATQSVLGSNYKLTQERGKFVDHPWGRITATMLPSAIQRMPDQDERHRAYDDFVSDLKKVRALM
jgi:uracil-DNA glycosylase family protein